MTRRAPLLLTLLAPLVANAARAQPAPPTLDDEAQELERLELALEPDGRGRLVLERSSAGGLTARILEAGAGDPALRQALVELIAAQQLAAWSGIEAWHPVEAALEGERLRVRATGWFIDAGRLVEAPVDAPGATRTRLRWRRLAPPGDGGPGAATGAACELTLEDGDASPLPPASAREVLALGRAGVDVARRFSLDLLGGGLGGWRRERAVVLPGPVRAVTPPAEGGRAATVDGARVALVETSADLRAAVERLYARLADLAAEVEAGTTTLDQAVAALGSATGGARTTLRADLPPGPAEAAAVDSFQRGLEAARVAWAASPWPARVEQAGALAEARPDGAAGGASPGRPATAAPRPLGDVEPNDGPAQARALAPGAWSGALRGEDWFRVDVPPRQALSVVVTAEGRRTDLDLELVDGRDGRTSLRRAEGVGRREAARLAWRAGGPVLVRVWAVEEAAQGAPYRLEARLVADAPLDPLDPNAPPEEPAPLAPGARADLVVAGEDRYRVTLAAGQGLEVDLAPRAGTADAAPAGEAPLPDLGLELRDAAGRVLARARAEAAPARASCRVPADGVVIVRVTGDGAYGLTVVAGPGGPSDALEPNDTPAAARALPLPSTHGALRLDGDDDWYRVELPAGHELRATVRSDPTRGAVDLALHAADGARLLRAADGAGGEARLGWATAAAVPLLVRVHGGPGSSYALTLEAGPQRPADRFEPNEALEAARPLPPGEHADLRCTLDDWYRVELAAGQRLAVEVRCPLAEGDLDLELWADGPAGRAVVAASSTLEDREAASFTAAAAGPCWVRVWRGTAPYRLVVRVE